MMIFQTFLLLDELPEHQRQDEVKDDLVLDASIDIDNVSAKWDQVCL